MSRRRKAWLALCAVLIAYLAWAWIVGLAFLSGTPAQDMDWDNDGTVTRQEKLQSAYAVTVRNSDRGARHCRSYFWRGQEDGEPIRVSCRTEVGAARGE